MAFTEEEVAEFTTEAEDLLDQAEKSLMALDKGANFKEHYDAIFRAFHSIKGAAGMMEIVPLQKHMHLLENILVEQKQKPNLEKGYIDLFLRGSDGARTILENRELGEFNYDVAGAAVKSAPIASEPLMKLSESPLPIKNEVVSEPAQVSHQIERQPFSDKPHGKVVVVDDEPDIVQLLESILVEAGFEVRTCIHSELAMDLIKAFKPNAVMTDLSMPKVSGLQLLQQIVQHDPDIPVTFISGNVTKDFLVEAVKTGIFGVIEKPFNFGRVIEACHQAVNRNLLSKLVSEGINLLMYQFADLDQYLKAQGKEDVRKLISSEITNLVEQRRRMRDARKVPA